jgi:hypothetical protein
LGISGGDGVCVSVKNEEFYFFLFFFVFNIFIGGTFPPKSSMCQPSYLLADISATNFFIYFYFKFSGG